MSDSPMWKRGKRSRSNSSTLQPRWARRVEPVLPAGPPPMTTTSVVRGGALAGVMGSPWLRSAPGAGGVLVRQAGGAEQGGQVVEFLGRQVAELAGVAAADRLAQLVQQGEAGVGEADVDDAAVVGGAVARHEAALLQLVQQAGDVRGARHQPGGEVERAQLAGVDAAQQAQGVVLLRGQVEAGEQLVLQGAQAVVGAPQA